jgi:hypothetical protein
MKMEKDDIIEDHEKRIKQLEEKITKFLGNPREVISNFVFSDKKKGHNELLEELLKSDFCYSKNGLTVEEILEIFSSNSRPVNPKKIKDLLAIWKIRKKIDAIKSENKLKYFWIENGR